MTGNLGMVGFGALLLVFCLIAWGRVAPRSRFAHNLRAQYEHRSPVFFAVSPFGPRRIIAMMPFFGLMMVAVGASTFVPDQDAIALPMLIAFGVLFSLGLLAFVWPRPFLPRWIRDADARMAAGLPPDVPPPDDLVAANRITRRPFMVANGCIAGLVATSVWLDAPLSLTGSLLVGWAVLIAYWVRAS